MTRRHFAHLVTAVLSGFALDPERALWVPGRKTIFDLADATISRGVWVVTSTVHDSLCVQYFRRPPTKGAAVRHSPELSRVMDCYVSGAGPFDILSIGNSPLPLRPGDYAFATRKQRLPWLV